MRFLRSNTAVIITVGPFYDKTDGVTIETGLTITNERITLTADTDAGSAPTNILDNVTGATSGTSNDLNYITGNDAGMMQLELAAADTNRVGRMFLSITDAANHVPVFHEFFVLPQAIYDWFTGVIVPLPANVTTWLGTAASTPTVAGVPNVNVKTWNDLTTIALPLVPTTAGRTLDVSTGGEAGIDWANIGNTSVTQNLRSSFIRSTPNEVMLGHTAGNSEIFPDVDSNDAGANIAGPMITIPPDYTIQSVAIYVDTAVGNLRLGLYDATGTGGLPGALKAESASVAAVKGWNILSMVTPVTLAAGSYYPAWQVSSNSCVFRKGGGQGPTYTYAMAYGSFDSTFSASPTTEQQDWSIYATFKPAIESTVDVIQADTNDIQTRLPAALVGGRMDASVGAMAANVLTATAIDADAITDAKVASDVTIASVTGAVGSVTGAVGSVTGAVGSVTGNVGGNVTGSVGSVAAGGIGAASFAAGAIDAAAIATDAIDADALKADAVTEIQSGLATAANLATAQTSIDDLPTNAELATALGTADDAVLAQVALVKAKTDLIPAAPAAVSDIPTAAANADAVWDELLSGHVVSGSAGEALAAATAPSASAVADAVWDEAIAGHLGAGSTGLALNSAGSAGDPWATSLPGAYGAGSAGKIIGDNVNATISSRATQTSVDDLPTNAELATALGTADDAVLAAIGGLTTPPTTAQIADKVLGRSLAGGADGGRTVQDALRSLRNKVSVAAGTLTVCEEDDSTPAWTAAVSTTPGDPLSAIDPA